MKKIKEFISIELPNEENPHVIGLKISQDKIRQMIEEKGDISNLAEFLPKTSAYVQSLDQLIEAAKSYELVIA